MKILQDELQNPKTREEFEPLLSTIVNEEIEKLKTETDSAYISKEESVTISERSAKRFSEAIIKGKF